MSVNKQRRKEQLAVKIIANASEAEKDAIAEWTEKLLILRQSNYNKITKGREAIRLTAQYKIIHSLLKVIAKETKLDKFDASKVNLASYKTTLASLKSFWNKRSIRQKFGIGAGTLTAIVFGGQGAGIAALGTAIGVPLWALTGAGAYFFAGLYEDITGKKPDLTTSYMIIEGKRKPESDLLKRIGNKIVKKR